jgi:hypothetical protein
MKRTLALMLFSLPLPFSAVLLFLGRGTEYEYLLMLNLFFPVIPLIFTGIGSRLLIQLDFASIRQQRNTQEPRNHL